MRKKEHEDFSEIALDAATELDFLEQGKRAKLTNVRSMRKWLHAKLPSMDRASVQKLPATDLCLFMETAKALRGRTPRSYAETARAMAELDKALEAAGKRASVHPELVRCLIALRQLLDDGRKHRYLAVA